jgi:hypothetical protein
VISGVAQLAVRWAPSSMKDMAETATQSQSKLTTAARAIHGLIAAVILAALVIQLALLFVGGVDANSGESGDAVGLGTRPWRLFSFFTIQSNLIVLAVAVVLLLRPSYDNRFWRTLRLDSLLGIVITGLVFAIVLAPQIHLTGWGLAATIGFHYISPWTTLAAWLVFGPRPRLTSSIVAAAFIWPLGWLIYTFTQGAFTDWYPYPFLDVTDRGFGHAVRNAALVLVIGVVLATILSWWMPSCR